MKHLEVKRKLIGTKVDVNWLKYKLYRNKKHLIKLNKFIDQLVVIDNILADKEKTEKRTLIPK